MRVSDGDASVVFRLILWLCVNSCTVRRKSVFRLLHLGHSTNTVAANYGSGYALEVMREHMEKVWNALEVTEQKQNKRA